MSSSTLVQKDVTPNEGQVEEKKPGLFRFSTRVPLATSPEEELAKKALAAVFAKIKNIQNYTVMVTVFTNYLREERITDFGRAKEDAEKAFKKNFSFFSRTVTYEFQRPPKPSSMPTVI